MPPRGSLWGGFVERVNLKQLVREEMFCGAKKLDHPFKGKVTGPGRTSALVRDLFRVSHPRRELSSSTHTAVASEVDVSQLTVTTAWWHTGCNLHSTVLKPRGGRQFTLVQICCFYSWLTSSIQRGVEPPPQPAQKFEMQINKSGTGCD